MKKGRHEIKYRLSYAEYLLLQSRIAALLARDENAGADGYAVRSVYFDDLHDTAYREKINGLSERRKFRIRVYNNDPAFIKLECKEKQNRGIIKRAARIDMPTGAALLAGDFEVLVGAEQGLLREFYCTAKEQGLHAVVTVDYQREAYTYPASQLRLTFDKHLRASGLTGFTIEKAEGEEVSLPVFPHDSVIMEIKYNEVMPEIVRTALGQGLGKALAISKYCLCRDVCK
jgi:hypothetical protein